MACLPFPASMISSGKVGDSFPQNPMLAGKGKHVTQSPCKDHLDSCRPADVNLSLPALRDMVTTAMRRPTAVRRQIVRVSARGRAQDHDHHRRKSTMSGIVTIKTRENGPLLVTGPVRLIDHLGNVYDTAGKPNIALCRCGASRSKPFCDGTHRDCQFVAPETAPPPPESSHPAS